MARKRLSAAAFSLAAFSAPHASAGLSLGERRGLAHLCGTRTALPLVHRRRRRVVGPPTFRFRLGATEKTEGDDADAEIPSPENPYADPNYPDFEFVNYDDPEYAVDQGVGDDVEPQAQDEDVTLAEIEAMREDRRRRNDEFQFETYHANILRGSERTLGEWTVFQTDTFMGPEVVAGRKPDAAGVPRLLKWDRVLKVVSQGYKIVTDPDAAWRVDGERIVHEERLATLDDFPTPVMSDDDDDDKEGSGETEGELAWADEDVTHVGKTYWPGEMTARDFRGPGGIMCVGKAYTICAATPLKEGDGVNGSHEGPFKEMRTELGVQENGMRFRIKLDYALVDEEEDDADRGDAPLHLRTLTVCRETLDGYWPDPLDNGKLEGGDDADAEGGAQSKVRRHNQQEITAALYGPPGAPGGLYDPPPVGSEERAVSNYMLLDFEGGATALLPHRLDQKCNGDDVGESGSEAPGWVTSLDWTPGRIRYQVDRKVMEGTRLKGLKTLELSEVQGDDAERYRPKDGGANMRQ